MRFSTLAIAAAATFAPVAAQAANPAGTVVKMGTRLLDEAFGFGVGVALDRAFGLSTTSPVDLSFDALNQISSLMSQAVDAGWQMHYENVVDGFLESAETYYRVAGDTNGGDAQAIIQDASDNAQLMDSDLRDLPTYLLIRSIQLRFMTERAEILELNNDPSAAAGARNARITIAEATLDHIRAMQTAWDGLDQRTLHPRYDVRTETWHSGLLWGADDDNERFVRCFMGTGANDEPIEVCTQSSFTCSWSYNRGMRVGRSCTSADPVEAELNALRPAQARADFARIFGDIGPLKVRLAAIAGLTANCPIGEFDGDDCYVTTAPFGTTPYVGSGVLYNTRRSVAGCAIGTFDGANCALPAPIPGTTAFVEGNGLYTTSFTHCDLGWFDGANCAIGQLPAGSTPFVYANILHVTPQPGNVCPVGNFDGANCAIGPMPAGATQFMYNGWLHITPRRACPEGTLTGDRCLIDTVPEGSEGFVHGGRLHVTPSPVGSCAGIGEPVPWTCRVAAAEPGSSAYVYENLLYLTPVP